MVPQFSSQRLEAWEAVRSIEGIDMSEKSDNICIELHAKIDDTDRRITDLNANSFGAGENAGNGPCAPSSLSRLAGDIGGSPPDVEQSTMTGRVNGGRRAHSRLAHST